MPRRVPIQTYLRALLAIVFTLTLVSPASARIVRIEIQQRTIAFDGQSFGIVGQYELLRGIVYGEVDPSDPLNARIVDVNLAPRNTRGMVEYSTMLVILKPIDMAKSNHVLLYDVVHRAIRVCRSKSVTLRTSIT